MNKYFPHLGSLWGKLASRTAVPRNTRFSAQEQVLFAKRLSFLISASVPLLESLHVLKEQAHARRMHALYDVLIADISQGQTLSSALRKFGRAFSAFAINIIRVGETSGVLAQNLIYLADELKKRRELRKKIQGALVYPIIVTVATVGVAGILTVYIFPKIMPIFISLNVALPLATRILLGLSLFLQNNGLWVFLGIIVFIVGFYTIRARFPVVRLATDRLVLMLPITGSIALYYNVTNVCRTLGLMLRSGIVLSEALVVVADTMENSVYRAICVEIAQGIQTGKRLSELMMKHKRYFPPMMTHMVAIGERTGNLSGSLTYLAELYESEVDDLTKNLSSAIEPVLMIVMGLLVGFVAISIITPIYQVTQSLQR
ncbi:MAG: type II secretion system F family protein [Patescibacteria group bacterium]